MSALCNVKPNLSHAMLLAILALISRRSAAALLCLLLMTGAGWAGERPAVKALAEIPLFAFGGIGIAGTISNGEVAFNNVLDSENATADFAQILKTGTPQAQCYALVGLRRKDRAAYDEQVKRFASSKQQVQTCAGCIMSKLPMSSVVANIQKGWYDEKTKSGPTKR